MPVPSKSPRGLPRCLGCWLTLSALASASVISDGTRGSVVSHVGADYGLTGGTKVGGNLFHSFSDFNLVSGESATFSGPGDVTHILARVTGGSASSIDGTIRSTIPGANLFLMNPKGFVFGPNAHLDVSGSFAVTTADYLKLSDGGRFNASVGGQDALTSAPVSAFGFLPGKPAGVSFQGNRASNFALDTAKEFSVIAGDLDFLGAKLTSMHNTDLYLVSLGTVGAWPREVGVAGAGSEHFSTASFPQMGTISGRELSGAQTAADGTRLQTAGQVVIRAGSLILEGSQIVSRSNNATVKGGVDVVLRGELEMHSPHLGREAQLRSDNFAGPDPASAFIPGNQPRHLSAGAIQTWPLTVTAHSIKIFGAGGDSDGGLNATNYGSLPGAEIRVRTHSLEIHGGDSVSASAADSGKGGGLNVQAAEGILLEGGTSGLISSSGEANPLEDRTTGDAGQIVVTTPHLEIRDGGYISVNTFTSGSAGEVSIHAGTIMIDSTHPAPLDASISSIFYRNAGYNTIPTGVIAGAIPKLLPRDFGSPSSLGRNLGRGGIITIVADQMSLTNGGMILSSTLGSGAAGSIDVSARALSISGANASGSQTGIVSDSKIFRVILPQFGINFSSSGGAGGQVHVKAADLSLIDGGEISAATNSSSSGGTVRLELDRATIGSTNPNRPAKISAESDSTNSSATAGDVSIVMQDRLDLRSGGLISASTVGANGGDVSLETPTLAIQGGAISAATRGSGKAGNVSVTAGSMSIDGRGATAFTGITAQTNGGSGNAGDVAVQAGNLTILNHGTISSSTFSRGNGGSVWVTADSLFIEGRGPDLFTGITAKATAGSTGNAGDVIVAGGNLVLRRNASITAASATGGPSGSVRIAAQSVSLDSGSIVSSENTGAGTAGSVSIRAHHGIDLSNRSLITTSAAQGDAGNIAITSDASIYLNSHSSIAASAGSNGGSIRIIAKDTLFLTDSSITATAGSVQFASGAGGGAGGNIFIDPQFIILDHSLISANAALGQGGNILLIADNFLPSESLITATGSTAGTVQITAPPLDLANALAALQASFVDISTRLQERCTMRLGADASSFLLVGRGSVEDSPDEPQPEVTARVRKKGKGSVRAR